MYIYGTLRSTGTRDFMLMHKVKKTYSAMLFSVMTGQKNAGFGLYRLLHKKKLLHVSLDYTQASA